MSLFDGEQIQTATVTDVDQTGATDAVINDKYVRGDIRIVTEQARYPLATIADIVESTSYLLSPEYQRRHRWDLAQKSRLIESLIMNVPVPPVFLYEYDYSKYEVMDGLQRLTAIHDFYRDKYELIGLTQWSELNGRTYSKLPEKIREGIDRRYLSSVILLKETAKTPEDALRLKQMVFERINSGGAQLTPQETRNAIFDGPLNRLCIRLSKNDALCRLWGLPEADEAEKQGGLASDERTENEAFRKMEDVELVLRFFAYRQKNALHKGTSLANYLDLYLRKGNHFPATTLDQLETLFTDTIALVEDVFGPQAFWLYRQRGKEQKWSWLERPTTTVYDSVMFTISNHLADAETLRAKAKHVQSEIGGFYQSNYATFEGRNVNPSTLLERDKKFEEFVVAVLAAA